MWGTVIKGCHNYSILEAILKRSDCCKVAHRDCGVPILGDTQRETGHGPEQPALAGELD